MRPPVVRNSLDVPGGEGAAPAAWSPDGLLVHDRPKKATASRSGSMSNSTVFVRSPVGRRFNLSRVALATKSADRSSKLPTFSSHWWPRYKAFGEVPRESTSCRSACSNSP